MKNLLTYLYEKQENQNIVHKSAKIVYEWFVENVGNCFITAKSLKWYPEWLEIIEESQIFCENESSLTEVSEEIGIITKVTFTLNEFKSEKLKHSKFTIL